MRVEPLIPDAPPSFDFTPGVYPERSRGGRSAHNDSAGFVQILDGLGETLTRAQSAENSFAAGRGSLHTAIYERTRADVALAVATAAAQRAAQAIQSILNMQV
jgi:flagellar hook-basal body complex protein FliE